MQNKTLDTSENINPNEHTRIAQGDKVSLHFSVALENGVEVDSTFTRETPVDLVVGDGSLIGGFEKAILGLRVGDKRTVSLQPDDGFGEWLEGNVQHLDKNLFLASEDGVPEEGVMMAFEDKGKNTLPGVVKKVTENEVIVDFNHPLAGKTLMFTVEIFAVLPAGSQEVNIGIG